MADRDRSRSPERGAPPADDSSSYPPQDGDAGGTRPADDGPPPPADANGDGGSGEEVKLYVGNLDYSEFSLF